MSLKYNHAIGARYDDCVCAGYRFVSDAPMTSELTESSVLRMGPHGAVERLLRIGGIVTGVWRSSSDVIHVATLDGRLMWRAMEARGAPWSTFETGAGLSFVWGLRDDLVFAGGLRGERPLMLRGDGSRWWEVPTDGPAVSVHGVQEDLLVAVGYGGFVGRWTGSAFRGVGSPVQAPLSSVHVVDGAEMYACGPRGHVLEGSAHGWVERTRSDVPLLAVRKWSDRVWLAAADAGLMTLEGDEVVPHRPGLAARSLDAQSELLVAAPDRVVSSADGERFEGYALDGLASALADTRPPWEP